MSRGYFFLYYSHAMLPKKYFRFLPDHGKYLFRRKTPVFTQYLQNENGCGRFSFQYAEELFPVYPSLSGHKVIVVNSPVIGNMERFHPGQDAFQHLRKGSGEMRM